MSSEVTWSRPLRTSSKAFSTTIVATTNLWDQPSALYTLSRGMGKRDAQFVMILDIDRVFSAEELASVRVSETGKPVAEAAG